MNKVSEVLCKLCNVSGDCIQQGRCGKRERIQHSLLTLLIESLEKEKGNLKEAEKMRQSCINAVKGLFGEGV